MESELENKIAELEADKAELIAMVKKLIPSYAGPVQFRDSAIDLYDKFSEKRYGYQDYEYFAKAAEERRIEEEKKFKNAA